MKDTNVKSYPHKGLKLADSHCFPLYACITDMILITLLARNAHVLSNFFRYAITFTLQNPCLILHSCDCTSTRTELS